MEEKQDTIEEPTNKSEEGAEGNLKVTQEEGGTQEQPNVDNPDAAPAPVPEPFMRRVRRPIKKPEEPPKEEARKFPPPPKKPSKDKEKLGHLPILLKKIREHQLFRDWVQKFWDLLQLSALNRVPRSEIRRLLHRIYKLLRPRYSESGIDQEISYTLGYYMGSEEKADLKLFTKILFDVVHIWAPNVDLIEYVSFLKEIYTRIIKTVIHKPEGIEECPIKVTVRFPEDEERVNERLKEGEPQWVPCKMDEVEEDDWEYTFSQDQNDPNKYEKLKRPKQQAKKGFGRAQNGFVVQETWEFILEDEYKGSVRVEEKLADTEAVLPLGYVGELLLVQLKNRKDDKEEDNALLIDDIIIENSIRQGMANNPKAIPIAMLGVGKMRIEGEGEVGEIVEQVLNYNIKAGNEHIVTVKVPLLENTEEVEQYDLPKGLNLKSSYSMGLRRRLFLERLKMGGSLEWVNVNYTLERHEVKWAIESHISLKPDNKNLVLTEEEGSALEKFAKGKSDTFSAPYLNDVEFPKFLQIVLGQKQIAIRKEIKYMKLEEEQVEQNRHAEAKDPLYKFTSFRDIKRDSYTSDLSIIDYAKQEVHSALPIASFDIGGWEAEKREVDAWTGAVKGTGSSLHPA